MARRHSRVSDYALGQLVRIGGIRWRWICGRAARFASCLFHSYSVTINPLLLDRGYSDGHLRKALYVRIGLLHICLLRYQSAASA